MSKYTMTRNVRSAFEFYAVTQDGVSAGEALRAFDKWLDDRLAEAWDRGALFAAVECGAIDHEREPWVARGDNPYRTEGATS